MQTYNYKDDFEFFKNTNIVYLDSAATSQKPKIVLDVMQLYYTSYCSNIHRSSHETGDKATRMYEDSRQYIAKYIGADSKEIVFSRGTTEAINLVAQSYVKERFDTVILTQLEHHSNIVPWQLQGLEIKTIEMDKDLNIDLDAFKELLKKNPNAFVSITHVSNSFGIINPVKQLINIAHSFGAKVLVDGAQAIAHLKVDVKDLDADFYAFSAHKAYGPTGIGALYGKYEELLKMKPYQGGGSMIEDVSFERSMYLDPPLRFEAGTQAISEVIGFAQALKYLSHLKGVEDKDKELMAFAKEHLATIPRIIFYTQATNLLANLSFNIQGIHHSDIGTLLSKQNIMLRTGHHCAMPIMKKLNIEGTVRISFAIYNTKEDILRCIKALKKAVEVLS